MANPRNITLSQKRSKSQNTNDSIHMKFITIQHRTIYSSGITLKSMAGMRIVVTSKREGKRMESTRATQGTSKVTVLLFF